MEKVYVILFDRFTPLDVFGPVDVLGRVEGLNIHYVSSAGGIVTNEQNIRMETLPFSRIEAGGILLVPGGFGTRHLCLDEAFLSSLREAADRSEFVLSVCTGSALLAKAGVLDGRKATSNRRAFDWVVSCGEKTEWIRDARWVVDGKFYTSAGVSAGIDMALGFVRDLRGEAKAAEICAAMEYQWNAGGVYV